MFKKYLSLFLTFAILLSTVTALPTFAEETVTLATIATDEFSTTDYTGSKWGSALFYKGTAANGGVYAADSEGNAIIAGKGFATNWELLNADGTFSPLTETQKFIQLYTSDGASSSQAAMRFMNGSAAVGRKLKNAYPLANAKYSFAVDIKSTQSSPSANRKSFAYRIGNAVTVGFDWDAEYKNVVPYIMVGEQKVVSEESVVMNAGSNAGSDKLNTLEATFDLNTTDTITVTVKLGENSATVTTSDLDVSGTFDYIAVDSGNCYVDNFYVKGIVLPDADDAAEEAEIAALDTVASDSFSKSEYSKNSWGGQITTSYADATTVYGTGFATNWLEKDTEGKFVASTDGNAQIYPIDNSSSANVGIRYFTKTDVEGAYAALYRQLSNPFDFDTKSGKYVFGLDVKSVGGSATNCIKDFSYEINDKLTVGFTYKPDSAVPYILLNKGTADEIKYTALNSIKLKNGASTAALSKFKVILDVDKDGEDTVTVKLSTDGKNASVTAKANVTGKCEYIGIAGEYCLYDNLYIKHLDYATLPVEDDASEDETKYPAKLIASEEFATNQYGTGWGTKLGTVYNNVGDGYTGTGWGSNWLMKDESGNLVALDDKAANTYPTDGSAASNGVGARFYGDDNQGEIYRKLSKNITFENVNGKYILGFDIKTIIAARASFKFIINDSLTAGYNYNDAGKVVPFITVNGETYNAVNNIAIQNGGSTMPLSKFKVILDLNKEGLDAITVRLSTKGKNAFAKAEADLKGGCSTIGIAGTYVLFDNIYVKGVEYSEPKTDYSIYQTELLAEEKFTTEDYANGKSSNADSTGINDKNIVGAYTDASVATGTGWKGNWLVKSKTDADYRAPEDADKVHYFHESDTSGHILFLKTMPAGTSVYKFLEKPISLKDTYGKYIFSADIKNGYSTGKSNVRFKLGDSIAVGYDAASATEGALVIEANGETFVSSTIIELGPVTTDATDNYYIHFDAEILLEEDGTDFIKLSVKKKGCFNEVVSTELPVSIMIPADLENDIEYIGFGNKSGSSSQYRVDNITVSGITKDAIDNMKCMAVKNGEFVNKDGQKLLDTSKISDSVVYNFNLLNYYKEEKTAKLFMAVYYDSKLAGVKIGSATVTGKGLSEPLSIGFTEGLPVGDKTNVTVKVFVWEEGTYAPFTDEINMYSQSDRAVIPEIFGADTTEPVTVAFMGDSITHLNPSYTKWIEYFYRIKYPEKDIKFVSKGISGDSASGIKSRFTWDILNGYGTGTPTEACLMIGMNDVNRRLYPDGTDEQKQAAIDSCISNIEDVIELCKENNVKLTLVTPPLYDEADYTSSENNLGVNAGLGKIAESVIELADKNNLAYIDFYGYINSFNSSLRSKNEFADKGIFNVADRIHATPAGTFAEGFIFLDQQINDSVIASVDFDFNTLMPNVKNADVKDLVYSDGVISYTYTPDSLPMYVTDEYALCNDTYSIPVTDSLNREIIKVTGLEEGEYDVVFDNEVLGSYTASELSEGINIATLETNPGYNQSKTVYDLVTSKMAKDYILRNIAYVER